MTKRFDREVGHIRHHQQTFCGLKHYDFNQVSSFSYEQLFQCIRELKLTYKDAEQMFRRMVFNIIARNCDDHTKNFSFLIKKGKNWELAPAYDLCHAYRLGSQWVSQHALSINGKRTGITQHDLLSIAQGISMKSKKASEIINEINATVQNWRVFADELNVDPELQNEIQHTLLDPSK